MSSMWDVEPLVDLGDDFDAPPPGSWMAYRWPMLRRCRIALPVVALLLLVAAAASAPSAPLHQAARVPIGIEASVMIVGSDLYVYDTSDGHNGIRAYELGSGRLQWSASTPEIAGETSMQDVDGNIVVSMVDTDASGEHTVTFDARTGRRLWSDEFGFATDAAGGLLVESAPRPPGYNFPGTVRTGTFRLLDPRTGAIRWTVDVPSSCVTDVGNPAAGLPNTLVELCSDSSRLTVIDLLSGQVAASRQVPLGDPGADYVLPPPDQMAEPQLVVAGGTLLIAHANAPQPTIDAYAMTDLNQLWTGLPVIGGQDINQCGPDLCVFDGTSIGSVVDLTTGKPIGLTPPRAAVAAVGALALAPVGKPITFSAASLVSSIAAGMSTPLQSVTATSAPKLLASRQVTTSKLTGRQSESATPIEILHGVDVRSCVTIAGFLACATTSDRLTVWQLP
jgi:putative pyrroloquinoline-quinone binding quinoprotein